MKRFLILTLVALPLLVMAQDDLYFTASKKKKKEKEKQTEQREWTDLRAKTPVLVAPVPTVDYNSNKRSEDEYNRRYTYGGDYQNAGRLYADDSMAARIDTVAGYYGDDRGGYDMNDPELDYRFSRRLVRFHNPRLYALASPYYWDLYYGYGAWDYLYAPYDPWYWHYGWGYGWSWGPWDCWYGGIWGWHHPHAWAYWGCGPGWGRPLHGGVHYRNVVPREYNSSRGYMAAGNRLRTNAQGGGLLSSRGGAAGRAGMASSRSVATGGRGATQGVRGTSRGSYTDYTNTRSGRTGTSVNGGAQQENSRARSAAAQRSTVSRSNGTTLQSSRSSNVQNGTNRTTQSAPRSNANSSYSGGSTRSASPSMGGGSRGGGSVGGGGSRGGGGRR